MDNNSRFSIFETVKNAYLFIGKEWLYLLKAGSLPLGAQIVAAVFVQFERPDASLIESYLWGLPAAMLLGWFVFLETRLLLLGERLDRLPKDPVYRADRHHSMKLCVLAAVLFNMGTAAAASLWLAVEEAGESAENGLLDIAGILIIGGVVWGVRFGIIPTLAAVHYPIRPALRQVRGMLFSLRLVGMGLLCTFPVILLFRFLILFAIPAAEDPSATLTDMEQLAISVISAPLSLICTALLSASVAYALKQILGPKHNG